MSRSSRPVVVLGGGIHGVSVAFHLATRFNIRSTIVEQSKIGAAASGKSGGFLAREWGHGPTRPLHQKSYDLHKELAQTLHLESYREITTLSVDGNVQGENVPSWLDRKAKSHVMDTNTAQVTSAELVDKMLQAAVQAGGVDVVIDRAVGVELDEEGRVTAVRLQNKGTLEADAVVICMGPWSSVAVEDWFGLPLPMEGIKSTSVVFHNVATMQAEPFACFCAEDRNGCHLELYPRPNGDLYICGLGGSDYVKGDRLRDGGDCANAELVQGNPKRVEAVLKSLQSMSSTIGHSAPDVTQACMRPCTADGMPVMGALPGIQGGYISTGHNCWGILWAPISGLCMAELIALGESKTVDLKPFSPLRYMSKARQARGRKKGSVAVGEQW